MMSVLEYASDVGKSVESIFELCRKLNIKVDNEDDMLSDDDIILLDNEIDNTLSEDDSEEEDESEDDDEGDENDGDFDYSDFELEDENI